MSEAQAKIYCDLVARGDFMAADIFLSECRRRWNVLRRLAGEKT